MLAPNCFVTDGKVQRRFQESKRGADIQIKRRGRLGNPYDIALGRM